MRAPATTTTATRTTTTTEGPETGRREAVRGQSGVIGVVVRIAGQVPVRTDLSHVGTREQQLGLSLGTVLVYLHSAVTARAVVEGWRAAAVQAQLLGPAVVGRRRAIAGPSTVAAMVRLAGTPR